MKGSDEPSSRVPVTTADSELRTSPLVFLFCFVLLCLLYRSLVWFALYREKFDPLGFDVSTISEIKFWKYGLADFGAVLVATAAFAAYGALLGLALKSKVRRWA